MKKCLICGSDLVLKNEKYLCKYCGNEFDSKTIEEEAKTKERNPLDILNELDKAKSELINLCSSSVVKVYVNSSEGNFTGTGWCGYKNLIITNAHVISDKEDISNDKIEIICEYSSSLKLGNKQRAKMATIYYNRLEDIAILKPIEGEVPSSVKVLKIISEPPRQGEMVFTIGNPLHYKFTYTEGSVAKSEYVPTYSKRKFPVLQTTIMLEHGNSGGPVFNTKGEIVGMTTFSELTPEKEENIDLLGTILGINQTKEKTVMKDIVGYGFCVSGKAIKEALNSVLLKIGR